MFFDDEKRLKILHFPDNSSRFGLENEESDQDGQSDTPPPMERLGEADDFQPTTTTFDQWPLYSNRAIDFKGFSTYQKKNYFENWKILSSFKKVFSKNFQFLAKILKFMFEFFPDVL